MGLGNQSVTAGVTPVAGRIGSGRRKVAFIGDSICIGDSTYQPTLVGPAESRNSAALYAMFASARGSWDLVQNAGVAGNTSALVLARLGSEVLIHGLDICVIFSLTWSDISGGVTLATSVANVTSMIEQCLAAGCLPVLCTPTPDSATGTSAPRKNAAEQRRRAFMYLGDRYNIPVVDLWPVLGDVTTGCLAAAYDAGSVHPNPAGYKAAGEAVGAVLDRICVGSAAAGVAYAGDADDKLSGYGFFAVDTNADGVGNGWTGSGDENATPSIYTDGTIGKMQRCTTNGTTEGYYFTAEITLTASHVYEIGARISKAGTSQGQISVNATSGNRRVTIAGTDPDITLGRVGIRWGNGASDTAATVYLYVGAGTGTVDFGRLTIRDLTALGVA